MTVRTKSLLIIGATLVGLPFVLYATSSRILLRGYAALEDRSVRQDVERVLTSVNRDLSELRTGVSDYAAWDDTCAFIEDGNRAYLDSNIQVDTFSNFGVNFLLYVNTSGRVVFSKGMDLRTSEEMAVPASLPEQIAGAPFTSLMQNAESEASGLLVLPEGPALVTAHPIVTSKHKGPVRGMLVFVRNLDATQIGRLAKMTQRSVSLYGPDAPPSADVTEAMAHLSGENPVFVRPKDERTVAGFTRLQDIHDKPGPLLRVEAPRDIYRQGQAALRHFFVHLAAVGAAFGVATFVLLEVFVFSRVVGLNTAVRKLARAASPSARIPVSGSDEMTKLAVAINGMLDAAQRSHEIRFEDEARFRAVVEQASEGICLVDAETKRIVEANATLQAMLCYTSEEIRRLTIDDILVSDLDSVDLGTEPSASMLRNSVVERRCRRSDGSLLAVEVSTTVISHRQRRDLCVIVRDITGRKRAQDELIKIRAAVDDATDAVVITDREGSVTYVNMAFGDLFKHTRHTINGVGIGSIFADRALGPKILGAVLDEESWSGEAQMVSHGDNRFPALVRATPILSPDVEVIGILLVINDISEQKELESQLLQAQKLTSIGQLAAGIAHEINTPTQYVGDNTRFLGKKIGVLVDVLRAYGKLLAAAKDGTLSSELVSKIEETVAKARVDYLMQELPAAVEDSLEGIDRVAEIVRAMKAFSHPGTEGKTEIDINDAIANTVTVARNEWKYVADVKMELASDLPLVPCLPGEFNQVILNLLVNSAQAIGDVVGDGSQGKGVITVSTQRDGDWVEIRVHDTGTGIPEAIRHRIFDPFFTTKEVGKGTGQGLTLSHAVITKKHGGTITFESETGKGTTFIIRLPLVVAPDAMEEECVHAG